MCEHVKEAVRVSGQASILASLFPPNASYFSYKPLDIMTRVLDNQDRSVRSSFLQNLCGTSDLYTGYRKTCRFCEKNIQNLGHYFFDCPRVKEERESLLKKITSHIQNTNPPLLKIWEESNEMKIPILFGGNYVAQNGSRQLLFRKSRARTAHHLDRVTLLTARFLAHLGALVAGVERET